MKCNFCKKDVTNLQQSINIPFESEALVVHWDCYRKYIKCVKCESPLRVYGECCRSPKFCSDCEKRLEFEVKKIIAEW